MCKTVKDEIINSKTNYNIISFPDYLFVLFDFNYTQMLKFNLKMKYLMKYLIWIKIK